MALPKDPNMLVSMVNMKLRDSNFDSLSDLCLSLGVDEAELVDTLRNAGFEYIPSVKQFR